MRVPTRIPSTEQQRSQESAWIEACHPEWGLVLMELAGRRTAELALNMFEATPGRVTVFCGRGNNGGDGLVVARYLALCGVPVAVYMVQGAPGTPASKDNETNRAIFEKLGGTVRYVGEGDAGTIQEGIAGATIVVDALLGTGIDRPVEGVYKEIIDAVNDSDRAVIAVDLPSGVHSDTGQIMGTAVRADMTVTFGYLKAGLLCHPGATLCGAVHLMDIGLPALESEVVPVSDHADWRLATADLVRALLPARPEDSHKGSYGHLINIAGSLGMSGASLLAAKSALRAGAGLSILCTPKSLVPLLPPQEVIYRPLAETKGGSIALGALKELEPDLAAASAIVLGPGFSTNDETVRFVHEIVRLISCPCIVDADALNAIAKSPQCWPDPAKRFVLTPHPKELARLLDTTTEDVQSDRIGAALRAALRYKCTVVLKGSRSVIANQDQQVVINPTGNAGMATAGAGDVLSGIIGALMAQGLEPFHAAIVGVYIHGAAGDMAAQEIGQFGLIAGDIMTYLPVAISKIRTGEYRGTELELRLFQR